MGVPVITIVAAWGSLLTTTKSLVELSRMLKARRQSRRAIESSDRVYRDLREARRRRLMDEREYLRWYEKLRLAEAANDGKFELRPKSQSSRHRCALIVLSYENARSRDAREIRATKASAPTSEALSSQRGGRRRASPMG